MDERSKQVRRDAIKLMREYGGYHYGGSFSCAEILIALYDHILGKDDIFILSKGHGCWVYYVLLREKGYNPKILAHPEYDPANGIFATTGSMGHGLPYGIGMALGKKLRNDPGRVFVLMGDGELQEGTTWESIHILTKLNLDNICILIDNNEIQGSGYIMEIVGNPPLTLLGGLPPKRIYGHSIGSILHAIHSGRPIITCETMKGYGVSFMQDDPSWHSRWLDDDLMTKALEELE